jgi:hypothetical protein
MELEQQIIIKFLVSEGFDANRILAKMQTYFGEKASASRTVRFWIRKVPRRREDFHNEYRAKRSPFDYIDTAIFRIIGKSTFESE